MTEIGRVVLSILIATWAVAVNAEDLPLVGEWGNADPNPRNLTRLIVAQEHGTYVVRAWGKCVPHDCELPKVELRVLGDSISDESPKYGYVVWDVKFKDIVVTLQIEQGLLVAEEFNFFKDKSRRRNYKQVDRFQRH